MNRKNKSHALIVELHNAAIQTAKVTYPFEETLTKAKKHIEFLELLVTGISAKDRNNIVSLNRRVNVLERRIDKKNIQLAELRQEMKALKLEHKAVLEYKTEECANKVKTVINAKLAITEDFRKQIEAEFVASLRLTHEVNKQESAYRMMKQQLVTAISSQQSSSSTYWKPVNEWVIK